MFVDYDLHRTYIPGVKQSRVSAVVNPTTVEVDYVVSVPVVSDERYTVRNHLCTYHGGESYAVEWTLVRASSTKATTGHARFEPHLDPSRNERGTVMVYSNFVTPGSSLAGLGMIKTRALEQMRETASALVRRIEAGAVEPIRHSSRNRSPPCAPPSSVRRHSTRFRQGTAPCPTRSASAWKPHSAHSTRFSGCWAVAGSPRSTSRPSDRWNAPWRSIRWTGRPRPCR